jgi:hypothetical protein
VTAQGAELLHRQAQLAARHGLVPAAVRQAPARLGRVVAELLQSPRVPRCARAHGEPRNTYIASSRYHHQIQYFLRYYKRDALLLYTLDELSSDPRAVCRELFERLGVDPDFDHPGIGQVHHSSGSKRRPTQTARALARLPGGRLIRYALPALLSEPMDKPTMSDALQARLVEVLKPDTDQLRALWGRDLAHWSC